jgi:hypothetical protein
MLMKTRDHGLQFAYREADGGSTRRARPDVQVGLPIYVRLVRSGDDFTYYYSTNGSDWTQAGDVEVPMGSSILVGMAVSSYINGVLDDGSFDEFSLCTGSSEPTPTPTPTPPCVTKFEDDFEGGTWGTNWTESGSGDVENSSENGPAHSGSYFALFEGDPGWDEEEPVLTSKEIDLSGTFSPKLSFWYVICDLEPEDYVALEFSSDGGTSWEEVETFFGDNNDVFPGEQIAGDWSYREYEIGEAYRTEQFRFRFRGYINWHKEWDGFGVDDVRVCDEIETGSISGKTKVLLGGIYVDVGRIDVYYSDGTEGHVISGSDAGYQITELAPGTYTLYAEAWIDNTLYLTTVTGVEVVSGEDTYQILYLLPAT